MELHINMCIMAKIPLILSNATVIIILPDLVMWLQKHMHEGSGVVLDVNQ